MNHLGAFYQSVDPAGALTTINAVQDQAVFTSGVDLRAPVDLPYIIGEVGLYAGAVLARSQVQSPSLRAFANLDVEPVVNAVTFGNPPEAMMHPASPVPVSGDEAVNFALQTTPAGGAEAHYGLVWFGDGPQQPVTGEIFTVRATATIAQAVATWTNGNLTFAQTLPVGTYSVVGMRVRSTDAVAARLVFVGGQWRPGVPCVNAIADLDPSMFRYGRMGSLGQFHTNTPPTLDVLGGAAAAQVILLDLIRVG